MFSGDRRGEALETYLRSAAVVLAAFVFTLLIFLLFQQLMQKTRGRLNAAMTEAVPQDRRVNNTGAQTAVYSPVSPSVPRVTAGYVPARPAVPVYAPAPISPTSVYRPSDVFSTNEERDQATSAVESLRVAIQNVRRYDSSFWQTIPKAEIGAATSEAGNAAAAAPLGIEQDGENGTPTRLYAATSGGSSAERQKVITRISNEAEALHTELSLVGHPDLFPEPVRNLAKTAGLEARIYLSTVQQSLTNPDDRSDLQRLAREHLNRSEAALRELERASGSVPASGGLGGL